MITKFYTEDSYFNLNFNIDLVQNKNIYCFIGENGVGKTKLLETLCSSLIYSHEIFNQVDENSILKNSIYWKDFNNYFLNLPLKIKLNEEDLRNQSVTSQRMNIENISSNPSLIKKYVTLPIAYIGAKDRGYGLNIQSGSVKFIGNKVERFKESLFKSLSFLNSESLNDSSVADWFVSRIVTLNNPLIINSEKAIQELKFLCRILKDLEPIRLKTLISEDSSMINLFINDGQLYFDNIPFHALSTGYMSIVKIFQEIINTIGSWNLSNNIDFEEGGIFFIDELEAHLHPRWESKFIPLLKKHFPNSTFYIATHSPIVLSSTEEGEAYELIKENKTVKAIPLGDPKNWYLADVYSQAFHLEDFFDVKEMEREKTRENFQEFSNSIKLYLKLKDNILLEKIHSLYKEILNTLSNEDPRKITLRNLYKLVE